MVKFRKENRYNESRPQAQFSTHQNQVQPIPFRSQSSELPLTLDGSPHHKQGQYGGCPGPRLRLVLRIDEGSDLVLCRQGQIACPAEIEQSRFLNDPSFLDISQTISGFEYYGRLTAGLTAVQMIGHGARQSAPVDIRSAGPLDCACLFWRR